MALDVATGSFSIGTGAAATTVSVTGLSFQPKVVLFKWSGRTATGQAEGDHKFGFGYMISGSDRGGATSQSDHAPTTMAADNQVFDDSCIKVLTIAGALDGSADFSSMNSDGFTVVIDDQFAASYRIDYLCIGGSDLTNYAGLTVTKTAASGNGSTNYTSLSFQPDAAIFMGAGVGAINATDIWSSFSLGVAAGATPACAVMAGASRDAQATSQTMAYCRAGEVFAEMDADLVDTHAALTAWLSNGFTLNWTDVASDVVVRVLCLKGGKYFVGDILSQTGTSNTAETGVGFTPKALMFGSAARAQSTSDVTTAHDERCVGFATASAENASGIMDKDASGLADIGVSHVATDFYCNQSTAATIVQEGAAGLVSMDGDGFTFAMSDADPSQNFIWYLAMGDAAAAGGTTRGMPFASRSTAFNGGRTFRGPIH